VVPTEIGEAVIAQARVVLREAGRLRQTVRDMQTTLSGELRLAVIPTLAPYLVPLFLEPFISRFPEIHVVIRELTTEQIIAQLRQDQLDVGLMATPSQDLMLYEDPLFFEEFVVYAPHERALLEKRFILTGDLDLNRLVLLEEGHCMRTQVVNLCALQKAGRTTSRFSYEAGSVETLRRLVENQAGITILPQLALTDLDEERMGAVRFFHPPAPVREISLVTHRAFAKYRLVAALKEEIIAHLPPALRQLQGRQVVGIHSV
jgi:LysR family hydrogen peroxide-inducible transcriptional activator